MEKIFEVGVRYDQLQQDGRNKRVTELFLMQAVSFSQAERNMCVEMTNYTKDDFDIVSIRITKFCEHILSDNSEDDKFYSIKYNIITLDEKTMKEKKQSFHVIIQSSSVDKAREKFKEYSKSWISDIQLVSVQETKHVDFITQ